MISAFVTFFLLYTKSSIVFDDLHEKLVMLLKLCSVKTVTLSKLCLLLAVNCPVHYSGYPVYAFYLSYG